MDYDIQIQTQLPILNANFDAISKELDKELARYENVVVTPDNIKQAKKDTAQINKLANQIDERRKEAVAEISDPIKRFESQMKDLRSRCKTVRQKILDQVNYYENKVRDQAQQLLREQRNQLWRQDGIREDFQRAEIADLATLTALTDKGNLTKSVWEKLKGRVQDDKAIQDKVDQRLLRLEKDSYAAGLNAPLTFNHVQHFIECDNDDEYRTNLEKIISSELDRERLVKINKQKKQDKEQTTKTYTDLDPNKTHYRVTAVFDVSVPVDKNIDPEQLKKYIQKRLEDSGIPAPSYMEAINVES